MKRARVKGWGSCYQARDQRGWEFATMSKKLALQVSWGSLLLLQGGKKGSYTVTVKVLSRG